MGCYQSSGPVHDPLKVYKTAFGIATVKIMNIHLNSIEENPNKMGKQFFAKLIVTNQTRISNNVIPSQFSNINFECQFAVNSRHLPQGRTLNVQIYERGTVIQASLAGVGTLDLDFVLKEKYLESMKIYLYYENNKVGWVEVQGQFLPCDTNVLTIMFDSAILRRKTSFGTMNCQVKTQIGQQTMYTSVSQDKKDQPANWKGEMFTFYYLKDFQKEGTITVYDGDTIIGSMVLNLEEFEQAASSQIEINEQFHFQEQVAGTLKFIISKGETVHNTSFLTRSAVVSPSKKKKTPFDKSKLVRPSKLHSTLKQQGQKDSQTHIVNLNQQRNKSSFIQIKKDKEQQKVQLNQQISIIQNDQQKKVNDNSIIQENKMVNEMKSMRQDQVQNLPLSQVKKKQQNIVFYEEQEPISELKVNKYIQQIVKQEGHPQIKPVNEEAKQKVQLNQETRKIEIRPTSPFKPQIQDATVSPHQNLKNQTNQLSPILNK